MRTRIYRTIIIIIHRTSAPPTSPTGQTPQRTAAPTARSSIALEIESLQLVQT